MCAHVKREKREIKWPVITVNPAVESARRLKVYLHTQTVVPRSFPVTTDPLSFSRKMNAVDERLSFLDAKDEEKLVKTTDVSQLDTKKNR